MEIKDYIKELLIVNQGVIIPGFGGFVSEYEPATFDVNENRFLPPSKKIIFKTEYTYQDHTLIDHISKKENIDRNKAKELLDDFVTEIMNTLNKGEKFILTEIGTFSRSVKKEIIFNQNPGLNLLADSFGLQSIKTKPITTYQKTLTKPSKEKKSFKKIVLFGSVTILCLCLIALSWTFTDGFTDFGFISSNENTYEEASVNLNRLNTEKNLDSIAKADSIKALINQSIDENTDKKDALFYKEPVKKEMKPEFTKFYIIAGSFKKIENATVHAEGLKKKGFSTEIIQSGENLFRISIYTYNDETEALKKLYSLREKSEIKSVWVLKSN